MQKTPTALPDLTSLDDMDLVSHARVGSSDAFRTIMQRHNRRLYRVARGVTGNDIEAETAWLIGMPLSDETTTRSPV